MRRALITTTIHVPHVLRKWREGGLADDDPIIVVGDRKTPHDDVVDVLSSMPGENVYIHPDHQVTWQSSSAIGWNCIQRRNIALLEAMRREPDYIITVDDDNYPAEDNFIQHLDEAFSGVTPTSLVSSSTGWFNAGQLLEPQVVARGFPLSQRHRDANDVDISVTRRRWDGGLIGVVASLWLGEPDIDAVERICCAPDVTRMTGTVNVALDHGTWCPFNTQATAYRTIFAPFMMVWPFVGRYDDIWASYLTQRALEVSGHHVAFGRPLVRQDRNPHNLVTDLRNELFGMEKTDEIVEIIRGLGDFGPITDLRGALDVMNTWYDTLVSTSWLPTRTLDAFDAWCNDVTDIVDGLA